jgi:hypothetical protein
MRDRAACLLIRGWRYRQAGQAGMLAPMRPHPATHLAAPLVNVLPGDVVPAGDLGYAGAVDADFGQHTQLLLVRPAPPALNPNQNRPPHRSPP